jgi:hypothetical protein
MIFLPIDMLEVLKRRLSPEPVVADFLHGQS